MVGIETARPALHFRRRAVTTGIILHATHTERGQGKLLAFLAANGRKMGLLEIGYHFVIQESGQVTECRPHDTVGSHHRPSNPTTIGIALAGGMLDGSPADTFTDDQKDALRFLCGYLAQFYGELPLLGHSERSPKRALRQCPPTDMEKLRQWTTQR